MRFYVRVRSQNALFRRMRFSSPGQTRRHLTEKRTLDGRRNGKPHSAAAPHQKAHSVCGQSRRMRLSVRSNARRDRRMRLSVRVRSQNALFRRMRFSSSAQTSSRLTEKRTLCWRLTKKRTLDGRRDGKAHSAAAPHQKAHSVCGQSRRMRFSVRSNAQNALFREDPCPECAFS